MILRLATKPIVIITYIHRLHHPQQQFHLWSIINWRCPISSYSSSSPRPLAIQLPCIFLYNLPACLSVCGHFNWPISDPPTHENKNPRGTYLSLLRWWLSLSPPLKLDYCSGRPSPLSAGSLVRSCSDSYSTTISALTRVPCGNESISDYPRRLKCTKRRGFGYYYFTEWAEYIKMSTTHSSAAILSSPGAPSPTRPPSRACTVDCYCSVRSSRSILIGTGNPATKDEEIKHWAFHFYGSPI